MTISINCSRIGSGFISGIVMTGIGASRLNSGQNNSTNIGLVAGGTILTVLALFGCCCSAIVATRTAGITGRSSGARDSSRTSTTSGNSAAAPATTAGMSYQADLEASKAEVPTTLKVRRVSLSSDSAPAATHDSEENCDPSSSMAAAPPGSPGSSTEALLSQHLAAVQVSRSAEAFLAAFRGLNKFLEQQAREHTSLSIAAGFGNDGAAMAAAGRFLQAGSLGRLSQAAQVARAQSGTADWSSEVAEAFKESIEAFKRHQKA